MIDWLCVSTFVCACEFGWLTHGQEPRWQSDPQTAAAAGCSQSPPCADLSFPYEPAGGSWGNRWCGRTLTSGHSHLLYSPVTPTTSGDVELCMREVHTLIPDREGCCMLILDYQAAKLLSFITWQLVFTVFLQYQMVFVSVSHWNRKFNHKDQLKTSKINAIGKVHNGRSLGISSHCSLECSESLRR